MAGPDSKRLYLSIVAQNLDNIKSERAYWNKNFIPLTPSNGGVFYTLIRPQHYHLTTSTDAKVSVYCMHSWCSLAKKGMRNKNRTKANTQGAGTKYTTLQAAMMLKKMQVVKFLARHPSIDITVKATDGRTTLMIAAQSNMPVPVLQKILEKYDLKTINECDSLGKTALDLAEPGSETYDFLKSVGCQTKAARDACLQGFFVSAGKAVHQRVKKKGEARNGKSSSCPPADGHKRRYGEEDLPRSRSGESNEPERSCSEAEGSSLADRFDDGRAVGETGGLEEEEGEEVDYDEESPWQLFKDPHDLIRVLQNYLDTWGDEGEEGELCREWVVYMKKKIRKNAASEAVSKWNKLVVSVYGEENVSEYRGAKNGSGGKEVKILGAQPNTTKRADERPHQSPSEGDSNTTTNHHANGRSKSSPRADKQHTTQRGNNPAQGEKEGIETGEMAGETSVERSRTVPESLRGFFNPEAAISENSASPPPQKVPPEGDRRRTLGVWLDKSDARERFAEVLPKSGSAESRRRHKKGSKI